MEMDKSGHQEIIDLLKSHPATQSVAKLGLCRIWTREAISLIREKFPSVKIEVREVGISEEFNHTFLRLSIGENTPILCDGTGVDGNDPYFGSEEDAPKVLLDSHPDPINNLISPEN